MSTRLTPRQEYLLRETRAGGGWKLTPALGKRPAREGWRDEASVPWRALLKHIEAGGNILACTGPPSSIAVVIVPKGAKEPRNIRDRLLPPLPRVSMTPKRT